MEQSRTGNAKKNTFIALASQIFIMIAGFLVPRFVIQTYGSEINGLTSNFNSILAIINLLQAGIVGASIFEMYKPIAKNDKETVGAIYYSSKKYFDRLSIVFFFLFLFSIPQVVFKTELGTISVIMAAVITGLDATMQFKYFCCYDVIFSAYQKRFHIDISITVGKVIYYALVFALIHFRVNYVTLYVAVFMGDLIRLLYLKVQFNRLFKPSIAVYSNRTDYKVKNQWSLFGNQIIQNIIESMPILLTSTFWGLDYSSILSVYLMVNNVYKSLFSTVINAISSSFGDLSARNDKEKTLEVFRLIQIICLALSIVFCFSSTILLKPFVNLYISSGSEMEYGYIGLAIVMNIYLFLYSLFSPYNMFTTVLGMYKETLGKNIVIGVISFGLTILLTKISFKLAFLGVGIYYFINALMRHRILKKNGYRCKPDVLIMGCAVLIALPIVGYISGLLLIGIESWLIWLVKAVEVFIIIVLIVLLVLISFFRIEFQSVIGYIK